MGLSDEEQLALRRGGFLHDLGKIAISDEILKKQGLLSPDEWRVMRQHPLVGENICKPLRSLRLVLPIIRHHHEHWDGSGYPDRLAGEAIPLLARVLQVVDVYDALRTERPYKPAHSHQQARETMHAEAESGLWDGAIVGELFSMLASRKDAA
jgi:putative two-component system response regulator